MAIPIDLGVKKGIGFHKHAHPTLLWKGTNADELLQVGDWISTSVSVVGAAATSMLPNNWLLVVATPLLPVCFSVKANFEPNSHKYSLVPECFGPRVLHPAG